MTTVAEAKLSLEKRALERLELSLQRLGWPAYAQERTPGGAAPVVVFLSPASIYKLAIAREGGRQAPATVHLALDASWLEARGGELWLRRGLLVDASGRTTIVEYDVPRRVRYFANFMTSGANGSDDGVPLERGLRLPMSSSARLERVTNDKLTTRLLLAARGVRVPDSLALLMPDHPLSRGGGRLPGWLQALSCDASPAALEEAVAAFLERTRSEECVVKPSGPQFHSGRGVRLWARTDLNDIVAHARQLIGDPGMASDGAVLIDRRIAPPPLSFDVVEYPGHGPLAFLRGARVALRPASAGVKKDWNLRVLAARGPAGGVTTGLFARAGSWGVPTTAEAADPTDNAAMLPYETAVDLLRRQHGLLASDDEARAFQRSVERLGAEVFAAVAEHETSLARSAEQPRSDQTDFLGFDVMVELEGGRLEPVVIEVNDHDSGGQAQLDEFYPEQAGLHARQWLKTALARARQDAEDRP